MSDLAYGATRHRLARIIGTDTAFGQGQKGNTTMDTRNVLAKLASSRAFVFALLMLVIVGVLVALGKAPYAELVSIAKWLGVTFIGAKSLEDFITTAPAPADRKSVV